MLFAHDKLKSVTLCFLQTVKFKSYLLSLGIPDPVTRDSHKSTSVYLGQLAKQVSTALHQPLQVSEWDAF